MPHVDLTDKDIIGYSMQPFPHFCSSNFFQNGDDDHILSWFENEAQWNLTEMDFYTQYEFSVLECNLPERLMFIVEPETIQKITEHFNDVFGTRNLKLVGITAHKLVEGHKIGIHNDYIGAEETHRLIVQINSNWQDENGGYLMMFNSSDATDVAKLIRPVNNSVTSFEISPKSYHAVSSVKDCKRYTLVYTFKECK